MKRSEDRKDQTGIVFLVIFIGLAAGLLAGGYFAYQNYELNFRADAERQISAIAELKASQLVQYRKERLGDAGTFFQNPAFSRLVRQFFERRDNGNAEQQLRAWLASYQSFYSYDGLFLLDARGVLTLSVPRQRVPIASDVQVRALEILRSGKVTMQDFHRNEHNQMIYLTVLVPIADDSEPNRPLGVLLLRIDPEMYLYPFIQTWPVPSRTSETLIVRREGNDVLFLNELRFQKNAALNLRRSISDTAVAAVKAVLGREGIIDAVDYRGELIIADVRKVPDSPWFMICRMDRAEIYEPLRSRLWLMIIALGALITGAGAGVGAMWRHRRNTFYREQFTSAEALRDSEIRYRRLFEAARDGILILDAETGMVADANPFMVELLGFLPDEFLGKKIWELGVFKDIVANKANFLELQQKKYIKYENLPLETAAGKLINVEFVSHVYQADRHSVIQCNIRDITDRRKAEDALRESEETFRQTFDFSPAGMVIVGLDKRFAQCNIAFARFLGCLPEELVGKAIEDVTFAEDRQLGMDEMSAMVKGEIISSNVEKRYVHSDGRIVYGEVTISLVRDHEGHPQHFLAIIQDTTESKLAQTELAATQRRYRELFDNVAIGVLRSTPGPEGAFVDVNPAMVKMFEADNREQLMAVRPSEIYLDPSQRLIVSDAILSKGYIVGGEVKFKTLKGKPIWCRISATSKADASGQVCFDGTIEDITERKQTEAEIRRLLEESERSREALLSILEDQKRVEEALRESQSLYLSFIEQLPNAVFRKDREGRFVLVNPHFCKLKGLKKEDFVGRKPLEIAARAMASQGAKGRAVKYADIGEDVHEQILRTGKTYEAEEEYSGPDGSSQHMFVARMPVYDSHGTILGSQGIMFDVSERKRAEEKIQRLNAELEQRVFERTAQLEAANKELEAFSYSVSHDLRAPLRSIDGFSQALLEDCHDTLDNNGKGYLLRVRNAAQRMGQLIDDVLDLSRIHRAEMSRVAIDLTTIVKEIIGDLGRQQPRSHVQMIIEPGMSAIGDPQLLRMCLQNLLENAWKFTSKHEHAKIEIGSRETDGKKVFYVKDDGAGFDMAHADMLFAPFQRLHAQAEFAGTGVGLASAQRVIHRHGGKIWAESEVEKGATFFFTL